MSGAPDQPAGRRLLHLLRTRADGAPKLAQEARHAGRPPVEAERVLQRLDWQVVRRLDGILQGEYRSLFRGHGLDLADIREYQPGDDVRLMDWNVTARTDQPHVRQYHEDREVTAWLLLDTSASIDFGTARVRKHDLAVDFAGALARLLTRRSNRVGALIFSAGVDRIVPPRGGRQQVLAILDQLLRPAQPESLGSTRLGEVLDRAAMMIRRRSLVFVVSDFICDAGPTDSGWEAPLSRLARRHEVVAVLLGDPREEDLPDIGPVMLQDAETGEQLYVDTHSRSFRRRFQALAKERHRRLDSTLAHQGIACLSLSTDGDLLADLTRFALRRKKLHGPRPALGGTPDAGSGVSP